MSTTIDRVHSAQKSGGDRGAERTRGLNSVGGIVLLALGLLVAPVCSTAQQAAHIPRVGFLDPGHPGHRLAFRQGLYALGYVEGETVIVERRSWEGRPERAPELIAELVRLKVDVLVIAGSRLVTVAKEVTTTLPIVMIAGGDPVTTGLIASFARPGGNITGLTVHHPELSGKTLELLKETLPHLSRVAALWEARGDPAAVRQMESAAQALGLSLQVLTVRAPDEFPRAFQAAIEGHAEALHFSESAMFDAHLPQLAAFAAQRQLPTMGQLRLSAEAGFLMSYGPDIADLFRRAATYVEKILHGAKPGDLPVERPTKFELVINLKTAQALGITVPATLLFQADEVIK
jgi:putative tryptophan/tyrosine transport system substrate-binding protein